jgi:hypothetical protein
MKKFVFISLILALVASVAFAQDEGSWSVGGSGEIGTIWNFRNRTHIPSTYPIGGSVKPTVSASGYNMYGWYGEKPLGTLGVTYSRGDLSAGINFDNTGKISANVSYDSGTIAFQSEANLIDLFEGNYEASRLWGYYKFLDGKIHLEAAVISRDTNYWISSEALGNAFDSSIGVGAGQGWGFTSVDGHNYLLANFAPIEGLEVGFMLPRVFGAGFGDGGKWNDKIDDIGAPSWGDGAGFDGDPQGYHPQMEGRPYNYLYNVFNVMRFGAKYSTGPVEVALQYAFLGDSSPRKADKLNSGLYLGGKYSINDSLNAGLNMEAYFDGHEADLLKDNGSGFNKFGIGVGLGYNAGALSAGLDAGLMFRNGYKKDKKKAPAGQAKDPGVLGVRPQVAYNIVENYLCLSLDAFVFLEFDKDVNKAKGIGYELTPELWFNVAGTGAGRGYYWPNGGPAIILRYKVGGFTKDPQDDGKPPTDPIINAFDITFKWAF